MSREEQAQYDLIREQIEREDYCDENKIAENLFQAIDTIISKRIENLPYNTTKICTIISDKNKDIGLYRVSDGSATFDVYSDSDAYKVDDRVRISIDNNDMTKKKYIVSKYLSNDTNSLITATSPMDAIIPIVDKVYINSGPAFGLTANGQETEIGIDLVNGPIDQNQMCNALYIKANFQSNLSNYDMRSGEYGIKLYLTGQKEGEIIRRELTLSSKDMLGNPYNLLTFTTQSGIYNISELGEILFISINFYQNQDFKYWNGTEVAEIPVNSEIKNLFVENIEIGLGIANLESIDDNTVKIFSNDSSEYGGANSQPSDNQKDIQLVWYNKSGANSYIGFSDGIYNIDENGVIYDELEYMKLHQEYIDLASQMVYRVPTDKNGLQCSRDTREIISNLNIITNYFDNNKNIDKIISNFANNAEAFFDAKDPDSGKKYETIYIDEGYDKVRKNFNDTIDDITDIAKEFYETVLSAAKTVQEEGYEYEYQDGTNYAEYILKTWFNDKNLEHLKVLNKIKEAYNKFEKDWNEVSNSLSIVLKDNANLIFYDSFVESTNTIINSVVKAIEKIENLYGPFNVSYYILENKLRNFFLSSYKFDDTLDKFNEADYQNRYCIYWYKYDTDYAITDEFENKFITGNWKRLVEYTNVGLSKEYTQVGDIKYHISIPPTADSIIEDQIMQTTKKKERYMVILFYNHIPYFSNVLEFYNKDFVNESVSLDGQAEIKIENKENSQDIYQLYGENNLLIHSSDSSIKRKIGLNYFGADGSGIEKLQGAQVFWYLPADGNSTMLTYDKKNDLEDFAFDAGDSISATEHSREGFYCFSKTISTYEDITNPESLKALEEELTFTYRIKEVYTKTINNTIRCKVIANSRVVVPEKTFVFSTYGNSGTDYTFTLSPTTSAAANLAEAVFPNVDLELKVALTDAEGNNIPVYYSAIDITGGQTYATGLRNYKLLPKYKDDEDTYSPYNITFYNDKWLAINDETNNKDIVQYIRISKYKADDDRYCGLLELKMDLYKALQDDSEKSTNITKLKYTYPITYLNDMEYSVEGADNIIYDSFGTNPTYNQIAYKLNGVSEKIDKVEWVVKYYDNKGNVSDIKPEGNYLPYFEEGTNILQIPEIYVQGDETYCVVECIESATKTVLAARPLNIVQNKYPIPTINEWTGGVKINEAAGSIVSAMLAAGCKNINNQFSGVVLGDVSETSDESLAIPGLYGFYNGEQTFGFKNNGTGFIGNSKTGRLNFDGEVGSIESANFSEENGLGMKINLRDPELVMYAPNDIKYPDGKIVISAMDKEYPLRIGGAKQGDSQIWNFVVDWNGNVTATGVINATSGTIGSEVKFENEIIKGDNIVNNAIGERQLQDGSVTTRKIANGAITIEILPNIPFSKIILQNADGSSKTLNDIINDYETRIATLEAKLTDDTFKSSVEAILKAHNLII